MRNVLVGCLLLLVVCTLHAQDETQVLLEAPQVETTLAIELKGQSVLYEIDGGRITGTLTDGKTFSAQHGVTFLVKDYHPLKHTVTVTVKKDDEPTMKGGDEFIAAALSNVGGIPGLGAGTGVATTLESDVCNKAYTECEKRALDESTLDKRTTELAKCKQERANCTTCSVLRLTVIAAAAAIRDLSDTTISEKERKDWAERAVGVLGIEGVRTDIEGKLTAIKGNLKIVRDARALLVDLMKADPKSKVDGVPAQQQLPTICEWGRSAESATALLANASGEMIVSRQQMADNLAALLEALDKYGVEGNWSKEDPKAYIIHREDADFTKKIGITVKFTPVSLNALGAVVPNEAGAITRLANLRAYRRLVTEFGAAAVWNDLKYPKYTVKEESGVKTVAANGFESSNVNAAATANLLCNCFGGRFVYPGLQIGVSKAKDYPGLLAGIVFRFVGTKKFAVAVGEMVTWYKDLNKLQVGSTVASENDIKADLARTRSPSTFYVAVQYNF